LGNTGLKLSCLGFGAARLGNVVGDVSPADALASVRLALQHGLDFFDTSPFASSPFSTPDRCRLPFIPCLYYSFFVRYYGGTVSETVLGNCLHELNVPREVIVVSNKCGRYIDGFDFSAERMTRSIDESLARLKLDYVDILHCHDIEFGSLDQVFINDSALVDLLPYLKSKGVGVISASPLAMCLLTDNGPPEWHPASLEFKWLSSSVFGTNYLPPELLGAIVGVTEANDYVCYVDALASEHQLELRGRLDRSLRHNRYEPL
ncbi:hypothetical protein BHE74_00013671, partial [Ensete ventricosum]